MFLFKPPAYIFVSLSFISPASSSSHTLHVPMPVCPVQFQLFNPLSSYPPYPSNSLTFLISISDSLVSAPFRHLLSLNNLQLMFHVLHLHLLSQFVLSLIHSLCLFFSPYHLLFYLFLLYLNILLLLLLLLLIIFLPL